MPLPRPTPVLSYTGDQPFGWREDPQGDAVLMLPHASNWSPLIEHAAGLMAATFFMICVTAFVVTTGRSLRDHRTAELYATLALGLLAIGIWTWVVVRCIRQARAGTTAMAELRVSPAMLAVTHIVSTTDADTTVAWDRSAIAELRLLLRPATFFRPTRVRLMIGRADSGRESIWLPWPDGEPVEPHVSRIQEILSLPSGD